MERVEKLPSSIKTIWRIKALITLGIWLIIAVALFVGKNWTSGFFEQFLFWASLAALIIGILNFAFDMGLVNYHWNYWTYFIDGRQVELHHGFFFRKQIVIPIARVQNVTLKQGPILRLKKLQKVVVETAAGAEEIAGLDERTADELKELIMKLAQEARNDI
ncbi:PH domain-containing protein [Companilactobacillus farciminis]|uniref:PH domain-containing protein n=1 Tax=Companilactobacillus farciminis TaxID=1612 RepID=UPI0019159203|nr:PH domain-containing protein [Companilactobacillus farciminis]